MRAFVSLFATLATASVAAAGPSCPQITTTGTFCFRRFETVLSRFSACGNIAVLCTRGSSREDECVALDLDKGTYKFATQAAPAPRATVQQNGGVVSVCVNKRCVATNLPASESPYQLDVSDDGKQAVVTVDTVGSDVVVLDTATGKPTRTVKLPMKPSDELGPAYFVGDSLLALVGQWPIERGFLVGPDGKARALDRSFGRGKPFALGGRRWAISSYGGADVTVLDTKTGALTSSKPPSDTARGCNDCFTNAQDPALAATRLALATPGRLVVINILGVSTIDARTLATLKTFPLPVCEAPRP